MNQATRTTFRLRACQTCGGDAYLDEWDRPEWRCLQCGRAVPDEAVAVSTATAVELKKAA